jgi:uncharacterized protein YgiM (DUF1202 family)
MTELTPTVMASGEGRDLVWLAKRVVPWIVLFLLVLRVSAIMADYYGAASQAARLDASKPTLAVKTGAVIGARTPGKAGAKPAAASGAKTVKILAGGVNFREEPNQVSNVVKALPAGATLTLLGSSSGWLKVRDNTGAVGWITASKRFVTVK